MPFLIHQAIDEAAERHPDKEAIRIYDESLSYGELVQRSNQLARRLVDQGVKRRDRVGIYMNKCMETAVAIYGIMKAGAAYVPLDPSSPINRVRFVISDCQIRHLISKPSKSKSILEVLAGDSPIQCVIGLEPMDKNSVHFLPWKEIFSSGGMEDPSINIMEQDLSYIMYTSGSTGDPKGIMHTHHSGLSYAKWAAGSYSLRPEDRLTNHAPLHFDLSTFDFFAGALVGATTVIVAEEYMKIPASYSKLLQDEKISVFFTVPFSLIQLLLRGTIENRNLDSLRWVIFGGEPFPTKYLRDLMNALPKSLFSNMYGPAEVNGCSHYTVLPIPNDSNEPIPIGRVCPNMDGIIVDENDDVVSKGKSGELLIRSPTMMQGYWGRPDLNKRAFYYDDVFDDYKDIYYRTGDLVECQGDGNMKFLGRKDRQVKIRGYRVELDEVEAAMVAHPLVEEAAIFAIEDGEGSNQIEAAVLAKKDGNSEAKVSDLSAFLRNRIPWYALPKIIEIHEEFPRTSSGKINRRVLQERARIRDEASKIGV